MKKSHTPGLPPITSGLVLMVLELEQRRLVLGQVECGEQVVGPMRRALGKVTTPEARQSAAVERARNGARVMLAGMCDVCPLKCPMKLW